MKKRQQEMQRLFNCYAFSQFKLLFVLFSENISQQIINKVLFFTVLSQMCKRIDRKRQRESDGNKVNRYDTRHPTVQNICNQNLCHASGFCWCSMHFFCVYIIRCFLCTHSHFQTLNDNIRLYLFAMLYVDNFRYSKWNARLADIKKCN